MRFDPTADSDAPTFAWTAIAIGAIVLACQLALATRYGWHRDELYFVACGRHLAWGYVDQPPFTPAVARLATAMFGNSLTGLRLFPALADAITVVLAAVIARDLGGTHRAQVLGATSVAIASVVLGVGHLLSTAMFDTLAWAAISALAVHALRTRDGRWWIPAGVVAGIGLENKYTVAFLLAGLAVGVAATRRDLVRDPWLWAGLAIALALWVPNLVWQAQHSWPVIDMSRSLRTKGFSDGNSFLFLPMQLVFLSPFVAPLWIAGLLWTLRNRAARAYRPLAVAWLVLTVVFIATAGKPYYVIGLYPFLLAAGTVWLDRRWQPRDIRRYLTVVVVAGLVASPLGLPVLPITAAGSGAVAAVNPEFRESYGWPQFAATVDRVPGAIAVTKNYGEAGALQRFGSGRPVYSGHNNYWLWGPPPDRAQPFVLVGHYSDAFVTGHFRGCRVEARIDNPEHVANEERGARVWRCAAPVTSWREEWPALRHYNA